LSTARGESEARHDLVKDEEGTVCGAEFPDELKESGLREIESCIGRYGLQNDGGDLAALFLKNRPKGLGIVKRDRGCEGGQRVRYSRAVGLAECQGTASSLHQERINVPVVATLKLDDPVAACKSSCKADRRHDGLGAGICHSDLLDGGNHPADGLSHLNF
jgi:hypothetical protein